MSCPIGHNPVRGSCEKWIVSITRTSIYFYLSYKTPTTNIDVISMTYAVRRWIENQFVESVCQLCTENVNLHIATNDTDTFLVSFAIDQKCDTDILTSTLRDFERQLLKDINFSTYTNHSFTATLKIHKWADTIGRYGFCPTDKLLWQKYYCTSIIISAGMERLLQKSGFMEEINEVSEIYNVDEKNEDNTIQHDRRIICLSHYREIVTNGGAKHEVRFNMGHGYFMNFLEIISFVYFVLFVLDVFV
ncbi:hypothetical protein ACF0H5_012557 [Mactra antiquata]